MENKIPENFKFTGNLTVLKEGKEIAKKKSDKHALKLARRRANRHNKQVAKRLEREKIGNLYVAKTMTGLAPYNAKGNTSYLVRGGLTVLAEKTLSGYRIYLGWQHYKTFADVKKHCKSIIARKHELQINTRQQFSF